MEYVIEFLNITYGPLFCCGLFVLLAWVSLTGKDTWPLTCYPMFSTTPLAEELKVYRIALEYRDGNRVWWEPEFPRMKRRMSKLLSKAGPIFVEEKLNTRHCQLLTSIVGSLSKEEIADLDSLVLIERKYTTDPIDQFRLEENSVARLSLPKTVGE